MKWLWNEIRSVFPVVLYFLICFNLVYFIQLLVRPEGYARRFTSFMGASIAALVVGKIVLISENLPFINAFPKKPIIWNISWRFFVYSIIVVLVQLMDQAVRAWYKTDSIAFAMEIIKSTVCDTPFWGIQLFELIFFLIFIVFSDFARSVGIEKTKRIFFGKL